MNIIKIESVFAELFNTIPTYEIEGKQTSKLFFGYGEQKALNQIITARSIKYPLLWYNLPNTVNMSNTGVNGVFDFVLACNTRFDYFNDQRFIKVFNRFLYPNLNLIMQSFRKANNIQLMHLKNKDFYEFTNYPNYGSPSEFNGKDKSKQVDYWDAINFKVRLSINNNCIGNFLYDTKNIF